MLCSVNNFQLEVFRQAVQKTRYPTNGLQNGLEEKSQNIIS